jgi:hypothetical protein
MSTAVLLLLGIAAAGAWQAPPAFTAADEIAAARALVGKVERGSAGRRGGPNTIDRVSGFVTADKATIYVTLLSTTTQDAGGVRHLLVLGGHAVDEDGLIDDSQAQQTEISLAVLTPAKGAWTMTVRSPALAETGFNGNDPTVAVQRVGVNRPVVEVTETGWAQGSSVTTVHLYEPAAGGFKEVLSVNVAADDCGMKDPCFTYEGTLVYDPKSTPEAYDLGLRLKGSYRNSAGRIVRIPATPIVLRAQDGTYAPVAGTAAVKAVWEFVTASPW